MPTYFFADLVRVACHATGTGALPLGDAVPGHRGFAGTVPPDAMFHYAVAGISQPEQWESGIGRLDPNGALVRDTVVASSNGGALVAFTDGLKTVALTVGSRWFGEQQQASAAVRADLSDLTDAVAAKQPLSTLHGVSAHLQADDVLTVRRNDGWVNVDAAKLVRQGSDGRFVMAGRLAAADGNVAAPALSFAADGATGWFRTGDGGTALSISGSERLRVAATGFVGVGTSVPQELLQVNGTLNFGEQGTGYLSSGFSVAGDFSNWAIGNSRASWDGSNFLTRSFGNNHLCQIVGQLGTMRFITAPSGGVTDRTISRSDFFDLTRLVIQEDGPTRPGADNRYSMGVGGFRWSVIYAATGTINTSDAREKRWRGGLNDAELRAASRIAREIGLFQWNDAIADKGEDEARFHCGVRAQAVWSIMADEGLVDRIDRRGRPGATPYAFLCYDRWRGDDARRRYDRYGVRVDQLALFVAAAQEARLIKLEQAA